MDLSRTRKPSRQVSSELSLLNRGDDSVIKKTPKMGYGTHDTLERYD